MSLSVKTSYKNVLLEGENVENNITVENVLTNYEDIVSNIKLKQCNNKTINNKSQLISNSKKEFLVDLLDDMYMVTSYVNEFYGFHGIGNNLKLEQVMDIFEKCVRVETLSDNDYETLTDDDDIV